jgi:hypothetical protein
MPTQYFSYSHIMLSSQHRNPDKANLCSLSCHRILLYRESRATIAARERRGKPLIFLCHLLPVGQWQSLPAVLWLSPILFLEIVRLLRFKAATVITAQITLWLTKKKLLIAATVSINGIVVHCRNQQIFFADVNPTARRKHYDFFLSIEKKKPVILRLKQSSLSWCLAVGGVLGKASKRVW